MDDCRDNCRVVDKRARATRAVDGSDARPDATPISAQLIHGYAPPSIFVNVNEHACSSSHPDCVVADRLARAGKNGHSEYSETV